MSAEHPGDRDVELPQVEFEPTDVRPGCLAAVAVAILVSAVFLHGATLALQATFAEHSERTQAPPATRVEQQSPPQIAVPLQTAPYADLENLRRSEDEALGTYGWVDRGAGVVRIPVERAIDLVVARGGAGALPVRAAEGAPSGTVGKGGSR